MMPLFDWITGFVEQSGYVGIALLMLLENVFPPIPSELIMPLAGYTAAQGQLNVVVVIVAGSVGSILGALFWCYVGRRLGCERVQSFAGRHGRWLTITPDEVDHARDWFRRHCGKAVFIGRLVPAVRTLISIPAGIAEMGLARFLVYTTAGTVLWTGLLVGAGHLLGAQYQQVSVWLNPVSNVIVSGLIIWYVYRIATFRPQESR
jgi:membrane protein DedA with SNARE-associated domain